MKWVITVAMVAIFVPNVVKLLSVSVNLLGITPPYFRWAGQYPAVLEDDEPRSRLRNSFTQIFFSIQTQAVNAVVCGLLAWFVWRGRVPTLSPWIGGFVSGISIAAGVSNVIIARYLIKEFLGIRETARMLDGLQFRLALRRDQGPKLLTLADVVCVYAAIGLYVVSAVACAGLVYFVYS